MTDSNERDPIAAIRENEDAVKAVAERNGRLGAAARVALALAHDEQPADGDLKAAGHGVADEDGNAYREGVA